MISNKIINVICIFILITSMTINCNKNITTKIEYKQLVNFKKFERIDFPGLTYDCGEGKICVLYKIVSINAGKDWGDNSFKLHRNMFFPGIIGFDATAPTETQSFPENLGPQLQLESMIIEKGQVYSPVNKCFVMVVQTEKINNAIPLMPRGVSSANNSIGFDTYHPGMTYQLDSTFSGLTTIGKYKTIDASVKYLGKQMNLDCING